jgi:uncharacterized damage-inducible protein DinB
MSIAQNILPEFDHEMANTRKVLERVPEAHADWKPHAKSYSLGELALHLANLPTWAAITLQESGIDLGSGDHSPPRREFVTRAALLEAFDRNVAEARAAIAATTDAQMMEPWTLRMGGNEVFTLPKAAVLRSFVMNHPIHHRGQLTVYLRMKDVPLPAIYGPSADEG